MIPQRTCVGCRRIAAQPSLVRFVRTTEGWRLDPPGPRGPGRGAYLCSAICAVRVEKNKRYVGLARAAAAVPADRWRHDTAQPPSRARPGHV